VNSTACGTGADATGGTNTAVGATANATGAGSANVAEEAQQGSVEALRRLEMDEVAHVLEGLHARIRIRGASSLARSATCPMRSRSSGLA